MKVAIVDDSRVALDWAKENLEPLGFEVSTYSESLGIQAFVRRVKPDIVLLDVNMPAMNGSVVCKMIKSHEVTKRVVVALYSSLSETELAALARDSGADGYIAKTDDAAGLAARITELVSTQSA